MILITCTVILAIILYKLIFAFTKKIDLHGPRQWPLIGNTFQLDPAKPHLTLDKWHRQFNRVFQIFNVGEPVVVVGSVEAMLDVLVRQGQDFAGRPSFYRLEVWSGYKDYKDGIVFANPDKTWKLLRQIAQKHIKQYDTGLERIQDVTHLVCTDLIKTFHGFETKPFAPKKHLMNAFFNKLTIFLLDKKYDQDDVLFKKYYDIQQLGNELFSGVGKHAVIDVFPWLRFFGNKTPKLIVYLRKRFHEIFKEVMSNLEMPDEGEKGCIMAEAKKLLQEGKIEGGEGRLELFLIDMIFAGSSTSTSILLNLFNVLTHRKDVQEKLQNEVDEIIGDRPVNLSDKENMPYVRATIFETLRYASISPTSVPHMAIRDSRIGDVKIPAGTQVLVNLFAALHDEEYWPDPYRFKPERFLDENGKLVSSDHINRQRLLPFGAGPRVCIGEIFSLTRLFLMLSTIIQEFEIDQDEPKMSCDPRDSELALVLTPSDFLVKMIPRRV